MTTEDTAEVEVLVVGAGPVGLTLACALADNDVRVRVIDKSGHWSPMSKAMTLTPRTLECFHMLGVAEECLRDGIMSRRINHHGQDGGLIGVADLGQLEGDYLGLLQISQSATTGILDRAAAGRGLTVERGRALVDIEVEGDAHRCHLRDTDGRTSTVTARFVVGADGGRSRVREIVGAVFDGAEQDETFIMADIVMSGFPHEPEERHQFWLDEGTFLAVLPIDGRVFRLVSTCRVASQEVDEEFVLRRFTELLKTLKLDAVALGDPYWISRFNPRQFIAERFRHQGIFLSGDAAHVQSPIGAQGLNTGIQDATDLAWKIALVLRAKAGDSLLESYHAERFPVAQALFDYNNMLSARVFGRDEQERRRLRSQNERLHEPAYHAEEIAKLSQFAVTYPALAGSVTRSGVVAGRRMPSCSLTSPSGPFDLLQELGVRRHVVLAFAGGGSSPGRTLERYRERLGDDAVRVFTVHERISARQRYGMPEGPHALVDIAGRCRERLGLLPGDVVVVRPDGFVGAVADGSSLSTLDSYLDRLFA
ncbi:2-polyprenyl-6-methoxyphenol hydroxylase [Lentzea fradiae]|uniref:2-polyprenyl-6-methoxyphenol hydroxylase n=1 Tax=Lentzea fradiae TaxID=200378 RepID=A0A1G7XI46_9PSEU|nr:FAD-dependent monooxygenase [Lentzea fradiae]SDG83787.1 2-polyprenyl-6-methoxyphenol hydroxylase [Lentzea fradiae]